MVLVATVAIVLAGCFDPFSDPGVAGAEELGATPDMQLEPTDVVADVVRASGAFAFETYVSVDLDISVEVIEGSHVRDVETDDVIALLVTDSEGNALYTGMIGADGGNRGFFGVSTALSSVTLRLEGPGLVAREVEIEEPATLESITRSMQIVRAQGVTALIAGTVDSDGDGVPDVYDAFPNDDTIAFEIDFPADGSKVFTVAFEDNFPSLGDGDYNDFVVNYNLTITPVDLGPDTGTFVALIEGNATARAKVAGYDHEFGLMFRLPNFEGSLFTTLDGVDQIQGQVVGDEVRVPLFPSTTDATNNGAQTAQATFSIVATSLTLSLSDFPAAPFDPYLYIKNTGYDVHLIDQPPLPGSRLPDTETYRDGNGFPRVLLVPGNFAPPKEVTSILDAYPRFQDWVDAAGGLDEDGFPTADWYFFPVDDLVMPIP